MSCPPSLSLFHKWYGGWVHLFTRQVMSCIQGDIQEGLREHCSQLINSTNQLITIAKMTAADDPSLLTPVTESIKVTLCLPCSL